MSKRPAESEVDSEVINVPVEKENEAAAKEGPGASGSSQPKKKKGK